MEDFLIRTVGGPQAGNRVVSAAMYPWPLPDRIAFDDSGDGVYIKTSESELPPMDNEGSRVMRGAEYRWFSGTETHDAAPVEEVDGAEHIETLAEHMVVTTELLA